MNEKLKTVITALAAFVLLLLMILWMAGAFEQKIAPETLSSGASYQGPTLQVTSQAVPLYEEVAGSLQSEQSSTISAQIMARVKRVHVHAGDSVNQGDLLIELDNADLRARVAQVKDRRNSLRAQLHRAKLNYDRTRLLHQKHSATTASLEAASAEYQSLLAQLSAIGESLSEAENALGYSLIRATFSGKIIDHFVDGGDMAAPGMRLLSVYDPHSLRVTAYVRESLALTLKSGLALQATIDALRKDARVFIDEIVPAAEPGSRSFLIKARIEFQPGFLPGMFARIRIPLGSEQQLLIPSDYVKQVGQLDVVWLLNDGVIERRFLRLGQTRHGMVKVISGLQDGDRLIMPKDL